MDALDAAAVRFVHGGAGHLAPVDELEEGLERHSGMAGLSGTSGDMREIIAGLDAGDARCRAAFDVYVHRLVRELGGMVAVAGGLDALVFTGGIGEHHPRVRAAVVERLGWLGLTLDGDRNAASGGEDRDVASDHSAVRVLVVAAREELVAAEHAARALARA